MPEFFNVLPPDAARDLLYQHISPLVESESVSTEDATGRVTAHGISSPQALPAFRRSTMDGYAVRAVDTFGASEGLPAMLSVVAEVEMGQPAAVGLDAYQAAIVHTGGMIPETADAVIQVEHTQIIGAGSGQKPPFEIEAFKAVAVGQNVLQEGEDVELGEVVLPAGHFIRPQDIGGLLALGITTVDVARQPRVGIVATGDELVHPAVTPNFGQIRDINSFTVASQTRLAGGIPYLAGIVQDKFEEMQTVARNTLEANDMLVLSAGSSVSVRDMTVQVIDSLGKPGVLLHGVATRPGKPTIIGAVEGKPVIGLPGNPVSAMIQFSMFAVPTIYYLQGLPSLPRRGIVWAKTSANIASETGREDYVPARLEESSEGLIARPVFGKSNLIYTLVNADGLIKVPLNKGGLASGEWVEVQLF
jgi:molybdopterin molybdotransferase